MRKIFGIILLICQVICGSFVSTNILFAENELINNYNTINYFDYHIINENEFYTINKTTNKIEYYKNGSITTFGEYGNTNGKFTNIKFFRVLKNGQFVVLDDLNRLQFYDSEFNFIRICQYIKNQNSFELLGNVTNITQDIYSNIYLIDETHNYILKANSSLENFTIVSTHEDLKNTKITILNSSNEIAILKDNVISLKDKHFTLEDNSYEIFSDALNFIYIIQDTKILKYNINLSQVDFLEHLKGTEYNLNLENGKIFYFKDNQINVINDFASNISNFEPPVNIFDSILLKSRVEIYTINHSANLLSNPYSNNTLLKLSENEDVLLLSLTENAGINFAYILFLKDDTYHLGYIESQFLTLKNINTTNYQVYPIRQNIKCFKYPTKLINFDNESNLIYNEKYTILREIVLDNKMFLEIQINENFAYIYNEDTINSNFEYIDTFINTNASLNLFEGEKQIYIYNNLEKENVILTLTNSANIEIIESYNNMSKISLIVENELITGYVDNKFISQNKSFVMPLTISLLSISILLLVVLIFKFKKESTKRKQR